MMSLPQVGETLCVDAFDERFGSGEVAGLHVREPKVGAGHQNLRVILSEHAALSSEHILEEGNGFAVALVDVVRRGEVLYGEEGDRVLRAEAGCAELDGFLKEWFGVLGLGPIHVQHCEVHEGGYKLRGFRV